MNILWFSCGASSAVMTKLCLNEADKIYYCQTNSEHEDNIRFLEDCEKWFNREIEIVQSKKYNDVDDVIEGTHYLSGVAGAPCTRELKLNVRLENTTVQDINYIGYTVEKKEQKRKDRLVKNNPLVKFRFPLIERSIDKNLCLQILNGVGIELPVMYQKGYDHNNCLGCVKSGSPKYWNMIRKDFPNIFQKRCEQSRKFGCRLVVIGKDENDKSIRIFLDELENKEYPEITQDFECDIFCQSIVNEL